MGVSPDSSRQLLEAFRNVFKKIDCNSKLLIGPPAGTRVDEVHGPGDGCTLAVVILETGHPVLRVVRVGSGVVDG